MWIHLGYLIRILVIILGGAIEQELEREIWGGELIILLLMNFSREMLKNL